MRATDFVEVFNLSQSGFRDWTFSALGLIPIAFGLVMFLRPEILGRKVNFESTFFRVFRFVFLGFAIFWTGTSFWVTYSRYLGHEHFVESNTCQVVEGQVEHFLAMPYGGHSQESFSVSGVRFSYSDYSATDAFNNSASHGGPINAGSYVRICYDPDDHAILRLAVRGFHGTPRDYRWPDPPF